MERLQADGWTDLCGGWMQGCKEVARTLGENAVGRVLLLTDGLANRGTVDHEQILVHVRELRARGVSTSTFGLGEDFDEGLLGRMAEAGGGTFHYIAEPESIQGYLTQEVGEALEIALPDAEVVLEGLDDVEIGSPNGYLLTRTDGRWSVAVGSLLSGQELSFLLDLRFPRGRTGRKVTSTLRLASRGEIAACDPASLQWTWASEEKNASQPVDRALRMERAELETRRIRQDAILLNRRNELPQSVQTIRDGAERIRHHSLDDPAILELAAGLEEEANEYRVLLTSGAGKAQYVAQFYLMKGRDPKGEARRWNQRQALPGQVGISLVSAAPSLKASVEDAWDYFPHLQATRFAVHYSSAIPDGAVSPGTDDHTPLSTVEEEQLAEAAGKVRAQAGHAIGLVFSPRPLSDNWFSHWHEGSSVAVVSTAGLNWVNPHDHETDLRAFVLYEILLHGLRGFGWRPEEHFHQDTRGCLFDFCGTRSDIEMKLQVGDFCSDCRRALERAGLYPSPAGEIAQGIQTLAWVCEPTVRTTRARGGPSLVV
jgi:Ca-activated chloride channel family protein